MKNSIAFAIFFLAIVSGIYGQKKNDTLPLKAYVYDEVHQLKIHCALPSDYDREKKYPAIWGKHLGDLEMQDIMRAKG